MSPRRLALGIALVALLTAGAAEAALRWGWLGVRIRDLSETEMDEISQKHGLREGFGAVIVEVIKDTPAEAAGLKPGDIVVAFRDRPVVDTRTLQRYISGTPAGESVPITVMRRDQGRRPVTVRVGTMPEAVAAERVAAEYGFFLGQADSQAEAGPPRPPSAPLTLGPPSTAPPAITGVLPRSRAEIAGLKAGDELVEVNGRPVGTIGALREVLLSVTPDDPLALVVRRDRERVTVRLDRAKHP